METPEVGLNGFLHYDMAISIWGQGVECDGLNMNSPYRCVYLNVSHQGVELFTRFRRLRRHVLVGGGVLLGVGFEVSKADTRLSLSISTCCLSFRMQSAQ